MTVLILSSIKQTNDCELLALAQSAPPRLLCLRPPLLRQQGQTFPCGGTIVAAFTGWCRLCRSSCNFLCRAVQPTPNAGNGLVDFLAAVFQADQGVSEKVSVGGGHGGMIAGMGVSINTAEHNMLRMAFSEPPGDLVTIKP